LLDTVLKLGTHASFILSGRGANARLDFRREANEYGFADLLHRGSSSCFEV
jgi:hypothetical protein